MSIAWEKEVETLQFSPNPAINNKIKLAVSGLQKGVQRLVLELPTEHDKELLADFVLMSVKQENLTLATKRTYVIALVYLSRYFGNKKSFEDIINEDLSNYINGFQKGYDEDPDRSWIATQRTLGWPLLKFYKWRAYPKLTPKERSRLSRSKYPPVLEGVALQSKAGGSKTPVKQKEIWDEKEEEMLATLDSYFVKNNTSYE